MRLKNKIAVVTGGSQGIGRGVVQVFAEEGAKVVIADIDAEAGENTVKDLIDKNLDVRFHKTDVSNEEDVKSLIEYTINEFGKLDVFK